MFELLVDLRGLRRGMPVLHGSESVFQSVCSN